MSRKDLIKEKLLQAMPDAEITIIDDSEKHRGHAGYREGGESHFRLQVVSSAFDGMSSIQRHRRVNEILADMLVFDIHALNINAKTFDEIR